MKIVIQGGTLIDGRGGLPAPLDRLLIKDGFIHQIWKKDDSAESVDRSHKMAEADQSIDATGLFICPGLINAHVHLYMDGGCSPLHDLEKERGTLSLLKAAQRCARILEAGITTVRDMGAKDFGIVSLRNAIAEGVVIGSRLVVSGPALAMTGGHALALAETVDGPEDIRRAVRSRLAEGVDFIKVFATGGFGKIGEQLESYELGVDEIKSAAETAKAAGKGLAAHAYGNHGIRHAIRAGAFSIEHGTFLDEETINRIVANGIFIVPTLSNTFRVGNYGADAGLPGFMVETAKRIFPLMIEKFQDAYKAGVKLPAGTDAGSWLNPHDDLVTELEIRQQAGVSFHDLICMATLTAAECLGLGKEIGSLETGKRADLIIVNGNPLENIRALRDIRMVMKDGKIYRSHLR